MLSFRRVIAGQSFIPQIDGLRFVAILSVVLFHLYASLNHSGVVHSSMASLDAEMSMLSKRGVELFFVISGFILGRPFAKARLHRGDPVNLSAFFARRITRLEPPFFLSVLICAAAVLIGHKYGLKEVRTDLLPTLFYLHQVIFHVPSIINGVTWSLEVEIQFYILVPVLSTVFFIRNIAMRRILLVAVILTWSVVSLRYAETAVMLTIVYYMPFFLAGLLFCDIFLEQSDQWKPTVIWDFVGLGAWPLVWGLGLTLGHVALPFIIVVLYIASFRGRLSSFIFSRRWITDIGGMCYTIYLYHFMLISAIGKVTKRAYFGGGFWTYYILQMSMMLPIVLIVCAILFLLVERPCMDPAWPRELLARLQSQKDTTQPSTSKSRAQ